MFTPRTGGMNIRLVLVWAAPESILPTAISPRMSVRPVIYLPGFHNSWYLG